MAKARTAEDEVVGGDAAPLEAPSAPEVAIIVEKYLARRNDIPDALKRVFGTIYKGQTHIGSEWDDIINRRLSRPAE